MHVKQILLNLGTRREIEQYFEMFEKRDSDVFCIVCVSEATLVDELPTTASVVAVLANAGLTPVVVIGSYVGGGGEQFSVHLLRSCREFAGEVESAGARARCVEGVVEPLSSIKAGLNSSEVPVVAAVGRLEGDLQNLPLWSVVEGLADGLTPHKVVVLSGEDVVGPTRERISAVNLEEDSCPELAVRPCLKERGSPTFGDVGRVLRGLPNVSSVSIVQPSRLLRELFTHNGAGLLVRRGERIVKHRGFRELDVAKLRDLLESSFGKSIKDGYFSTDQDVDVFLATSYRAAAIVKSVMGTPYLDKLAVTPEAQGDGIAGSLWRRLRADYERMFWRSRHQNPINDWYARNSDGFLRTEMWCVYWFGDWELNDVQRCATWASREPRSLVTVRPSTMK